jgi:hypothetical protein
MYFQPESFQQANPVLAGMGMGNDLIAQQLKNYAQGVQNQYLSPMLQQQLEKLALNNQILQPQAQYAPDITLADLQNKIAQTGLMGSETDKNKLMAQLLPEQIRAQYLNSLGRYGTSIRGWIDDPATQAQLPQDLTLSSIVANLPRQFLGGAAALSPTSVSSQNVSSPNYNDPSSYNTLPPPAGGYKTEGSTVDPSRLTQVLQPTLPSAASPQAVQAVQNAASGIVAKKSTPADIQKRLYAGERYKQTADQVIQNFDAGAAQYFSPQGQAQLKLDQANAAVTGKISPRLQAYRNFLQGIEQLNVQGAMLEGVPADQISRGNYAKVFDVSKFANSPQGARAQLVNAINLGLRADQANKTPFGTVVNSPTQLYSTQPSTGAPANTRTFQLPSFGSKQEFQQWYASQSPDIQAQVRQQLSGRR